MKMIRRIVCSPQTLQKYENCDRRVVRKGEVFAPVHRYGRGMVVDELECGALMKGGCVVAKIYLLRAQR